MYEDIDRLKTELDSLRPCPKESLESLKEDIIIKWTYNSNAIEGNTLSLLETKVVLEGITVGGKTMNEHREAHNHKNAILYVWDMAENKTPLSEMQIRSIHQLVLKEINDKDAGKYRTADVFISGSEIKLPEHFLIKGQMETLMDWYNNTDLHPIEKASMLHTEFVKIHPFIDGNGRTGRLLLNYELIKSGYVPAIIKNENKLDYYKAIREIDKNGDYKPFYGIVADLEKEMLGTYLSVCRVKDVDKSQGNAPG